MKQHWIDKFLPPMRCDKGCGDCCGPAPCSESDFQRAVNYAHEHGVVPVKQGSTCPFYQQGQCAVHEARPSICRLFGHSRHLVCTRGYNVNLHPRVEKLVFLRTYSEIKTRTRLLHEAVYGLEEFAAVVVGETNASATPVTINGKAIPGTGHLPPKTYHAVRALQEMGFFQSTILMDQSELPAGATWE